jgi:glycosyltransferase involved in cell wall biosynthesis
MHGAPGSGGVRRRERAAVNEPIGAFATAAADVEPVKTPTLVIIPAWNEEEALPGTLAELARVRPDLDVLVVSDGSTDRTAEVGRFAGATVVELPFNLGIGGALQTGFRYAVRNGYERAVQFDADGQHDPLAVQALLDGLDRGADMVIGSRFTEGGAVTYSVSGVRRRAMRLLQWLVKVLVRQRFTDTSSGFRAFSRPMLEYFAQSYPVEYMDSVEALVQACNAGFRVDEVPANMRGRTGGAPSTRNFKLVYYYMRLLVVLLVSTTSRGQRERRSARRGEDDTG